MDRYPETFQQVLVHTGQHYDANMSDVFFAHLGMRAPDEFLNVGSGTHAEQTARVMLAFEPCVARYKPDWVVIVGDVNSTVACALVCSKLSIPVAHVEAGLRSGDRKMPEEINRLVTDRLSALLFTPSADGDENLLHEGIDPSLIHRVGNVMIDTLVKLLPPARQRATAAKVGLARRSYVLVTLHRPANVDNADALAELVRGLMEIARLNPVVFPVHPRTRQRLEPWAGELGTAGVRLIQPQGYLDFLSLMESALAVVTDSGGVQEETCYLRIPCLTMRPNTERPVTIACGTNRLVEISARAMVEALRVSIQPNGHRYALPDRWDGAAAKRIIDVFRSL
jgi:UDP-N-acetylglucosamine 2-epimerase (non-hydrolysing)